MTVQVTDSVEWINQCYNHEKLHEHVSLYLVREGSDTILIDSGSFYHRDRIAADINDATDGTGPDAINLSHSDYPHAANLSTLGAEGKGVELIASSDSPELQGLPEARKCNIGGEVEIKNRRFSFIDPPLADRSHTTWIYDHHDRVLFTADGFGNYHEPGQCNYLSGDFSNITPSEYI
jgi:flavorubredoxin